MQKVDSYRIFPVVRANIHAEWQNPDPTSKREDVNSFTLQKNTIESIRRNFLNPAHALHRVEFTDGNIIQTIKQEPPYAYGSVMTVAGNLTKPYGTINEQPLNESDQVSTQVIYTFPFAVQTEYLRQTFRAKRAMYDVYLPGTKQSDYHQYPFMPVTVENTAPQVNNEVHRTGRSIAIPHTIEVRTWHPSHVIHVSHAPVPIHLLAERHAYTQLEHQFQIRENIADQMKRENHSLDHPSVLPFHLEPRSLEPHGYTIVLPISLDESIAHMEDVQRILYSHHSAYQKVSEQIQTVLGGHGQVGSRRRFEKKILPQPNYRTYMYFVGHQLHVTISPKFLSHVGAIEATGASVKRRREHQHPYHDSPQQYDDYFTQIGSSMRRRE